MNNRITLKQAKDLITRFRGRKPDVIKPGFENALPTSETFEREAIDKLLANPRCVKVRIYPGMSEDMNIRMIIVGVDSNDQDILPLNENGIIDGDDDDEEVIVDEGLRCPPFCPPTSPLNP